MLKSVKCFSLSKSFLFCKLIKCTNCKKFFSFLVFRVFSGIYRSGLLVCEFVVAVFLLVDASKFAPVVLLLEFLVFSLEKRQGMQPMGSGSGTQSKSRSCGGLSGASGSKWNTLSSSKTRVSIISFCHGIETAPVLNRL